MLTVRKYALALGLAALSASSFADTTVYSASATFLAAIEPGAYTNSFDGLTNPNSGEFSGNGFSYTLTAPGGLYVSGEFIGTNLPDEALTLTFTSGNVSAAGANFYATNISDEFQPVSMTVTLSDGTAVVYTPATTDAYRGFASTTTITSVIISAPGTSLYAGLDNLTVGVSAVPEPTTGLLMALGAAGLLVLRRRQA